jgi:glycogen phosphorylase
MPIQETQESRFSEATDPSFVREQIRLLQPETGILERYGQYTFRTGQQELLRTIDSCHPIMYITPGIALPGLAADGGLELLSADHFLNAVDLNQPSLFFSGAYTLRKTQTIVFNGQAYIQKIIRERLPSLEEIGATPRPDLDILLSIESEPVQIRTYEYPIKNEFTRLLLLDLPGEIYPGNANSNERLWNDVVLGFGSHRVIRKLMDQRSIEYPAYAHAQESQTSLGILGLLDNKVFQYGDTYDSYQTALREVRHDSLLTNHTLLLGAEPTFTGKQCEQYIFPNIASNEVKRQLSTFIEKRGGVLRLLDLGLYLAGKYNAVSVDHGARATKIFQDKDKYGRIFYGNHIEFPAVTNGIYEKRWNKPMVSLLEKYNVIDTFGLVKDENADKNIDAIPAEEMKAIKYEAVQQFKTFLDNGKRKDQFGNKISIPENAVIVGDARRVAEYKRRWMMFVHPERIEQLLNENPNVYIFLSGKAHPDDTAAQEQLHSVLNTIANNELFKKRIFFAPDWEPEFAQKLIAATSIWLNTPEVGLEACGTSGMKAAFGGALLVSTKDGFLAQLPPEAYYAIDGPTNSQEEFDSYYTQFEKAVKDTQDVETWANQVKLLWKNGLLDIASGSRMLGTYNIHMLPPSPEDAFRNHIRNNIIYQHPS